MMTCDFNHLLLYAKKHYKATDTIQDVKKILCKYYGLEGMTDRDVWEGLVYALDKFCGKQGLVDVMRMLWDNKLPFDSSNCTIEHAMKTALVILSLIRVKDDNGNWLPGMCLGEPDPEILPLAKKVAE